MDAKKSIFISNYYMEVGGVERSLIGLLEAIDYDRYEVDLFIHRQSGEFMKFIPDRVNLLPEIKEYATWAVPIKTLIKQGFWGIAFGRLLAKRRARKFGTSETNAAIFQYIADATTRFMPKITDKQYDLAISFVAPHNAVAEKIKARKKIAWIHTDYSTVEVDQVAELPVWNTFETIAAISESSKVAFAKCFPSLESKIVVIENMLSPDFVREQASLETVNLEGEIKLLTVGRFCYPKALDNAVRICAKLIKMGLPVKWYAIGYGDEQTVRDAIEACGMQEHFVILGKKSNPYPYMKACDIYVQPSRYEGKAVTVREAQMLGKPVVITKFPTSASQLHDGVDGVVVPMEIQGAALGIKALIEDKALQNQLIWNCQDGDFGNMSEVKRLYQIIE